MKFGMLSAVLVVCTLMISTIDLSQNFVFAQNTTSTLLPSQLPALDSTSTPATPASGSNDESSSSDDNNSNNDDSNNESSSHLDLLTMITTAKIVTHNKMQYRVMATAVAQKIQHRVKKKMRLKMISSRQTHYWNK